MLVFWFILVALSSFFFIICTCVCVIKHVEVRGQLGEISFLLPPCVPRTELMSGVQAGTCTHQTISLALNFFKIYFISNMLVCLCWWYVHVNAGAHRDQRHQIPLELELTGVVSCPA